MIKLKKLLPDTLKNRRSRRNVLTIQITMLGWLVELLGFLMLILGSFILGNTNGVITMALQTAMSVFYGIFLPCTVLINSSEIKDEIVENRFYLSFIKMFGCQPEYYSTSANEDDQPPHANDEKSE